MIIDIIPILRHFKNAYPCRRLKLENLGGKSGVYGNIRKS